MSKQLDLDTINKLLRKQNAKSEHGKPVKWPNDEGRVAILHAVRSDTNYVKIGYRLYGVKLRTVLHEPGVYVWPLDGRLTPCGEFRISTLELALNNV